jgi:hypothetical protein
MDRPTLELPVLHPLLREVEGSERLREFAQALPARARAVSYTQQRAHDTQADLVWRLVR